jgi:hypothetical protein
MGYIKRWDVGAIQHQLSRCSAEMKYSGNDGFTAWSCKKDLLDVKYMLDRILADAPHFSSLEDEYHKQQEQHQIWNTLNEKTNR